MYRRKFPYSYWDFATKRGSYMSRSNASNIVAEAEALRNLIQSIPPVELPDWAEDAISTVADRLTDVRQGLEYKIREKKRELPVVIYHKVFE